MRHFLITLFIRRYNQEITKLTNVLAVNATLIVIDVISTVFLSIVAIIFRIDVQCNENEHV